MSFSVLNRNGRQLLTLNGRMTIRQAGELAETLVRVTESSGPVDIDTSGLEDIDTCILQLLCSLQKSLGTISFDPPSGVFMDAMERTGLLHELPTAREAV